MPEIEITINSTADDVFEYLKQLKLDNHTFEDVAINFKNECIDGKVFLNLEKTELNNLGIFKFSRRNSFYKLIESLREKDINKGWHSPIISINNKISDEKKTSIDQKTDSGNLSSEVINVSKLTLDVTGSPPPHIQSPISPIAIDQHTNILPSAVTVLGNALSSPDIMALPMGPPTIATVPSLSDISTGSQFQLPITPAPINFDNIPTPSLSGFPPILTNPLCSPPSWIIGQNIQGMHGNSTTNSSNYPVQPVSKVEPIMTPPQMYPGQPVSKVEPITPMLDPPIPFPKQETLLSSPKSSVHDSAYVNNEVNKALKGGANEIEAAKKENEKSDGVKTEYCYYRVRRKSKNVVKFIGVYRGINSAKQIFLLMSRRHVEQFNRIAKSWANSTEVLESFNSAIGALEDESFNSRISQESSEDYQNLDGNKDQQQIIGTIFENTKAAGNAKREAMEKKVEDVHSQLAVTMLHANSAQQVFNSNLKITKMNNGWDVEGHKMPFNPMCVFTFDFFRNEIIDISAMDVEGIINNIDCRGLMWITCSLKIDAIEDHEQYQQNNSSTQPNGDKCGSISYIQYLDNRKQQFKDREVSYLIHDWTNLNYDCDKGDKVKCCMKLSTKTNTKWKQRKRPVYIQTWNVRPIPKPATTAPKTIPDPQQNVMSPNPNPMNPAINTYPTYNNYPPAPNMMSPINNMGNMGYNGNIQMPNYISNTPTQQLNTMMMSPSMNLMNPAASPFMPNMPYPLPMGNIGSTRTMDTQIMVDTILNSGNTNAAAPSLISPSLPGSFPFGIPPAAPVTNSNGPSIMGTSSIPVSRIVMATGNHGSNGNGASTNISPQKNDNDANQNNKTQTE